MSAAADLDALRHCLEGAVPAAIATVAVDGTPNVTYVSQVHYVDHAHVALSFQFFNKTRENVLANPRATVQVLDPDTAAHYRLSLEYLRTETSGPLFERMKAKLAGIASHTGMAKVFRLRGADIYAVRAIEAVAGAWLPRPPLARSRLPGLRACAAALAAGGDLDSLFDSLLAGLRREFGIQYAMLLMHDGHGQRLYTVASLGYPVSGVGSEIPLGAGVIGVAARERTAIRISHWTADYAYGRALRDNLPADALASLETEIPFPGLEAPGSQLAVPILVADRLLGVLYVESPEDLRFDYEDEDALVTLAHQLALAMRLAAHSTEAGAPMPADATEPPTPARDSLVIRRYGANDSLFIGEDYLIKGVAGAILWKLLNDHQRHGRTEFSNRELRLAPDIRLPDISDNLEARLILLRRRLAERCDGVALEKTGRGRFRLRVDRPLTLLDMDHGGDSGQPVAPAR